MKNYIKSMSIVGKIIRTVHAVFALCDRLGNWLDGIDM